VMPRADRTRPPGTAVGMVGSVVMHAAVAGLLFTGVGSPVKGPPPYHVKLVASNVQTEKKRLAREAIPTPPQPKPAPVKPQPPKPTKKPAPPEPKKQPVDTNKEPPAQTVSPVQPLPGETPSTGTDVANIDTPGLEFPFPEYLQNIVAQIYRNWDRDPSQLSRTASLSFMILRDGTVRDIRFVNRSGSFSFDLSAQGAVEASANANAFGPLPDGWDADVLPVTLIFRPTR
jgi:periplasmic protein TonB